MYYCIIAVNIIMKDDWLKVTKRQPLCFASQPFGSAEPTVLVRYLQKVTRDKPIASKQWYKNMEYAAWTDIMEEGNREGMVNPRN